MQTTTASPSNIAGNEKTSVQQFPSSNQQLRQNESTAPPLKKNRFPLMTKRAAIMDILTRTGELVGAPDIHGAYISACFIKQLVTRHYGITVSISTIRKYQKELRRICETAASAVCWRALPRRKVAAAG